MSQYADDYPIMSVRQTWTLIYEDGELRKANHAGVEGWADLSCDDLSCPAYTVANGEVVFSETHHFTEPT